MCMCTYVQSYGRILTHNYVNMSMVVQNYIILYTYTPVSV